MANGSKNTTRTIRKKPSVNSRATRSVAGGLPTIRDVARDANVSVATVSNVINGRHSSVSERTRKFVQQQIDKLGYRPHATGRSLRTSRRQLVAMVMIDDAENYLLDPLVGNLVAGFTDAVNRRGYATVVHGCRARDLENTVVIKTLGVDGYCLSLSGDESTRAALVERLLSLQQPIVLAQEPAPNAHADICVIRQDDFAGGVQLADHLIARGVRRIVMLLPVLDWPAFNARLDGLRSGAKRTGQPVQIAVLRTLSEGFEDSVHAVEAYLAKSPCPDALVCGNDQMAAAAIRAARNRGLTVPKDVLVTGFNALEFWQYTTPTLTTVRSRAREIGSIAGNALIDRLTSGSFAKREIVLPVTLLVGDSTAR